MSHGPHDGQSAAAAGGAPDAGRLDRLERGQRRLAAITAVLALLLVLNLAWQVLPLRPRHTARRFVVAGAGGAARAELAELQDGTVALRLNDAHGKARAMWRLSPDGSLVLYMSDAAGHRRAELALSAAGDPVFSFGGRDGSLRAVHAAAGGGAAGPGAGRHRGHDRVSRTVNGARRAHRARPPSPGARGGRPRRTHARTSGDTNKSRTFPGSMAGRKTRGPS